MSKTITTVIVEELTRQAQTNSGWVYAENGMKEVGIDGHFDLEALAGVVGMHLLGPMLDYEGGELQSMSEQSGATSANDRLIRFAESQGITFPEGMLVAVGRRQRRTA